MRVRLSDTTRIDDFVDFLRHSGFTVALEAPDTAVVSLPARDRQEHTEPEVDVFLSVWLGIALRVWRELWPDTDAIVLSEPEPARRALP